MDDKTVNFEVLINTIDKVKDFVATVSAFNADMDIVSGRYTINAKSILGLFSLDLSKPVRLYIDGTPEEIEKIKEALASYIVQK